MTYVVVAMWGPGSLGSIEISGWHVTAITTANQSLSVHAVARMENLRGTQKQRFRMEDGASLEESMKFGDIEVWQSRGTLVNVDLRHPPMCYRDLPLMVLSDRATDHATLRLHASHGVDAPVELLLLFDAAPDRIKSLLLLGRELSLAPAVPNKSVPNDRDPFQTAPPFSNGDLPWFKSEAPVTVGPISISPDPVLRFGRIPRGQAHKRRFIIRGNAGEDLSRSKTSLERSSADAELVVVRSIPDGKNLIVEVEVTGQCPPGLVHGDILVELGLPKVKDVHLQFNGFVR